jgi:hypothetical protein
MISFLLPYSTFIPFTFGPSCVSAIHLWFFVSLRIGVSVSRQTVDIWLEDVKIIGRNTSEDRGSTVVCVERNAGRSWMLWRNRWWLQKREWEGEWTVIKSCSPSGCIPAVTATLRSGNLRWLSSPEETIERYLKEGRASCGRGININQGGSDKSSTQLRTLGLTILSLLWGYAWRKKRDLVRLIECISASVTVSFNYK